MKTKIKNIVFILTIIFSGVTLQSWTTKTEDSYHKEILDIKDLESNLNSITYQDCDFGSFTITYGSILPYNEKKAIRKRNNVHSFTVIDGNTEIWVIFTCISGNEGSAILEEDPEITDAEPNGSD